LDVWDLDGALAVAGIIFVMGYVAASGGMIEHFVYFKPAGYPVKVALITFVEVLTQTLLIGLLIVHLEKWPLRATPAGRMARSA
jgi:hypothetical protein